MNLLQEYQLWIGLAFVIVVLAFLIFAFFKAKDLTPDQRNILRIISAFGAGFCGALITGEALFKYQGGIGPGTVLLSGTGGVALFFVVWFSFPKVPPAVVPPPPDRFKVNIPDGWTFRETVDSFVKKDNATPQYKGFKREELAAKLRAWNIEAANVADAIRKLRSITVEDDAIRPYEVTVSDSNYLIQIV